MLDLDPRDFDSRDRDNDRPDPSRGSGAGDDSRDREPDSVDHREVFVRDLDLPRGLDREMVRVHEHVYELNGSDSRTLATGTTRSARSPAFASTGPSCSRSTCTGTICVTKAPAASWRTASISAPSS